MEARKSDDDDNRGQSRRFPVEAMRRGQRGDDQRQIRIKEQQARPIKTLVLFYPIQGVGLQIQDQP